MVNGINIRFNLPIQFEFINCLQSHEKPAMILMALDVLTKIGIKVIAITFDGLANNFTTCVLLGAIFNVDNNFRPYIINPITKKKVYIILDPPHMVKLLRNCIGTLKTLHHSDGFKIDWKFFEALIELESKCDIVTHKMTKDHVLFHNNIMNVRLAVNQWKNWRWSQEQNLYLKDVKVPLRLHADVTIYSMCSIRANNAQTMLSNHQSTRIQKI